MPTGYTAGILDGTTTTFEEFAKKCMRNFGAVMHMRDDSMDAEYQKREPSDYYRERIRETREEISNVKSMTDTDIIEKKKEELEEHRDDYMKYLNEAIENKYKMDRILTKCQAYMPPTKEHEGIKEFMIEQIESTINFDCDVNRYSEMVQQFEEDLKKSINPSEERKQMLDDLEKSLHRDIESNIEEGIRCRESNEWVEQFLNSL